MPSDASVTHWIQKVKEGDAAAAQRLWEGYFHRLVSLARAKLRSRKRRVEDEEDAALSAFDSFCRGAEKGRFPQLFDRDDLWRLLVTITVRKALDVAAREGRIKQGGGQVRGDSAVQGADGIQDGEGWDQFVGPEPTPDFAAQAAEEYGRLLALLDDDELRSIAVWKLEGYSNDEIAAQINCARATVERRLVVIRKIWEARSVKV